MDNIEQGTAEWFAKRCGKITASKLNDVMAKMKVKKDGGVEEPATRKNYKAQLVAERLTGQVEPSYTNKAMEWGTQTEPHARTEYEMKTNTIVEQIDFIDHPTIKMAGASPDGLIDSDGLVEIKCPLTSTHLEWLIDGICPSQHFNQIQWQMACTGRKWCDFVSYDPRLPKEHQLFIIRVMRDNEHIKKQEEAVKKIDFEVEDIISKLNERSKA
jgi:putative phage-type endonuclease